MPQEWTEQGDTGIICKEIKERWVCVRPAHGEEGRRWLKTIDGHFRGSAASKLMAQSQLEKEALSIGSAWELP